MQIANLERRLYGRTGESVTVIGLGGAYLDKHSFDDGVATVRRAVDLGINYFDTAPAYGAGTSQKIIGHALAGRNGSYLLATKLGGSIPAESHRSPHALRAQLRDSLQALRCNRVDVLQVHEADLTCWWQDGAHKDYRLSLEDTYDFANAPVMQVLREAKRMGLCRFIGITSDHSEKLAHILRHVEMDACLDAYGYTLLCRRSIEHALHAARKKGIAYIASGVIKSIGADEGQSTHARLNKLQKESGLSPVTLTIRYLLVDSSISTILVGAATPTEVQECVEAAQAGPLPPDLHRMIEGLGVRETCQKTVEKS